MSVLKKSILIVLLIFSFKSLSLQAIAVSKIEGDKKVVLITGASSGIGLSTAKYLAKKDYIVYGAVRNLSSLDTNIKNLHFETLDVTDIQSIQKTVSKIISKEGRIDVLINNAGYALGGSLETLSMDDIKNQMDVNFFGAIRMCQEVLPHMRKNQRGHIINISSEQGVYGLPYGSLYSASKAALESVSESLSIELLPWNIKVSIVEPGQVGTNFVLKMGSKKLKDNPYQKICDFMESSHNKRTQKEKALPPYQKPDEIAAFLFDIMNVTDPQLRYQTNKLSKGIVSMKLNDISGEDYFKKMTIMIEDFQKRLIKK